jgi:hypothetical protein
LGHAEGLSDRFWLTAEQILVPVQHLKDIEQEINKQSDFNEH